MQSLQRWDNENYDPPTKMVSGIPCENPER